MKSIFKNFEDRHFKISFYRPVKTFKTKTRKPNHSIKNTIMGNSVAKLYIPPHRKIWWMHTSTSNDFQSCFFFFPFNSLKLLLVLFRNQ